MPPKLLPVGTSGTNEEQETETAYRKKIRDGGTFHVCPLCSKNFKSNLSLDSHLKKEHNDHDFNKWLKDPLPERDTKYDEDFAYRSRKSKEDIDELDRKQEMQVDSRVQFYRSMTKAKKNQEKIKKLFTSGTTVRLEDLLVEESWSALKEKLGFIDDFLKKESERNATIYPPRELWFNALNSTALDNVKVVIIGQEPEVSNQAMGLCFSVPRKTKISKNALYMHKALKLDLGYNVPLQGNLQSWAYEGVLLLNTVLTVATDQSHVEKGWEHFTDAVIQTISDKKTTRVVFLLWGKSVHKVERLIDTSKHSVLKFDHQPQDEKFVECRHFSETNHLLEEAEIVPIWWELPYC